MYRNTTVGSLPLGLSRRLLTQCCSLFVCLMLCCGMALWGGLALHAQSTAGGGIQGTITDPTGAVVRDAEVTATNTDTGVATTKKTNNDGVYSMILQVGPYNVEVVAKGFSRHLQENVSVDNASMLGLNIKLSVGGASETITVTDAPSPLDTTDATLGGTIENDLYSQLPLSMNGGPRDPTAFQYLMPGVQENPDNNTGQGTNNGNSGIYGGTGQTNLNENYIEGVPVSSIAQQGSSVPVMNAVSVDAVNQFSVQTSGASTSFGGAGVTNYTINSGGNQYHGTVFDFVRNTMFDTWGYFAKVANAETGIAVKPGEHQNNYGGSLGGPIMKDKLFFFGSYEGYVGSRVTNTPSYITVPTCAERGLAYDAKGHCTVVTGVYNFTDVLGSQAAYLNDPTSGGYGSRQAYQGLLNGIGTNNVVPPSAISPISQYLASALPLPTNGATQTNYLASLPLGTSNYDIDVRLDYTLNTRNKFSVLGLGGLVGYGKGLPDYPNQSQLPIPYASGAYEAQKTATGILSYTYIVSQTMINSLKYSYTRSWGEGFSLTDSTQAAANAHSSFCSLPGQSLGPCNSTAAGINNLPAGNAANSMPSVTFHNDSSAPPIPGNEKPQPAWASTASTGPTAQNSYTVIDNLQWTHGRHNIQFGAQVQWLEANGGNPAVGGYSNTLNLTADANDTAGPTCTTGSPLYPNCNGDAFASFLVGVYSNGSVTAKVINEVGGRFRPMAPYVQDNWQVSPKLTLNLGFRYDYLQPYHEVKDRLSFLNVNTINPIVGIPGVIEFAGFPNASPTPAYAPYICHCTTPVHPYNKNFEPRLGFAYAYTPATVFSANFGIQLTHAGGAGGGATAAGGSGNSGEFQQTTTYSQGGTNSTPAFFLNPLIPANSSPAAVETPPSQGTQPQLTTGYGPAVPCVTAGTCSPFSTFPPWTLPGITVNPLASTGNYPFGPVFADHLNDYVCNTSDNKTCNAQGVNFADPYYGGRGPQLITYAFSIQHMINKKAVLTVSYSGSETHFLSGGGGRGYANNEFSPDYNRLIGTDYSTGGSYTGATPSGGVITAASNFPYPLYNGTGATIGQSLRPFPQFKTMSDLWGDTGNSNYNSLQMLLVQRPWHNLSGTIGYTRQKQIDDTGNHRSEFPIGPQDGNFTKLYSANEIDRGLGQNDQTNKLDVTWVYAFPIGRGQAFFATNRLMGLIGGGWQLSGIYRYRDGYPLQITNNQGCMSNAIGVGNLGSSPAPAGLTCLPDYSPTFDKRQVRINGRWGRGPGSNAVNFNTISYINPQAFQCVDSYAANPTYTCGSVSEPNITTKIGNVARSAPDGLHGPGWWDVQMGLRRTFNIHESAKANITFQFEADVDTLFNSTFFNINSTAWQGIGNTSFGQVNGQNRSIPPRDFQFAGRFRF